MAVLTANQFEFREMNASIMTKESAKVAFCSGESISLTSSLRFSYVMLRGGIYLIRHWVDESLENVYCAERCWALDYDLQPQPMSKHDAVQMIDKLTEMYENNDPNLEWGPRETNGDYAIAIGSRKVALIGDCLVRYHTVEAPKVYVNKGPHTVCEEPKHPRKPVILAAWRIELP